MTRIIILAFVLVMMLLMLRDSFAYTPEQWIELYKRDCKTVSSGMACRQRLERSLGKMFAVRHMLLYHLEKANLPGWLSVVPVVESGFDPEAESHAGAVGLWQFMRFTAERFGINDRTDPVESTKAACLYLQFLKKEFGTWELALMAYNAGEMKIINWKAGKTELTFETENYFSQITAVNLIVNDIAGNRGREYGFNPRTYRTKYFKYYALRIMQNLES